MKKNVITIAVAATLATGAALFPTAAQARWHHGFLVAPFIGGLAAGALIGAAIAAPHYYDGYEPVYYAPRCVVRRERFWDGWGWRFRRVEDCY